MNRLFNRIVYTTHSLLKNKNNSIIPNSLYVNKKIYCFSTTTQLYKNIHKEKKKVSFNEQTKNHVITFIGFGNMAESMANGLKEKDYEIRYVEASSERRKKMKHEYPTIHGSSYPDETILMDSDMIILSVKPQHLSQVIPTITPILLKQPDTLLVSIAGGITIQQMLSWMKEKINKGHHHDENNKKKEDQVMNVNHHPIIRCMPNTAAFIGESAVGLYATEDVTKDQCHMVEQVMSTIAKKVIWVKNEDLLHTITGVSGSGPAYFFLIMEAMKNAGVEAGLTPEDAEALTIQTCLGAALMAKTSDDDLIQLRKKVTSPNGTTEAAIKSLEKDDIRTVMKDAIFAARDRSKEISEESK